MRRRDTKRRHTPKPPNFTVTPASTHHLPDTPSAWARVSWLDARNALREGQAVHFGLQEREVLGFWRYLTAVIGMPIVARYSVKQHTLSIMRDPELATLDGRGWSNARLRVAATILIILADAELFRERMQLDQDEADVVFTANRGDGRYPVEFDVQLLRRWRTELERTALPDLRLRYAECQPPPDSTDTEGCADG